MPSLPTGVSSVFSLLDLSQRVNSVKEENKKLKTENDVSTDTPVATFLVQTCVTSVVVLIK